MSWPSFDEPSKETHARSSCSLPLGSVCIRNPRQIREVRWSKPVAVGNNGWKDWRNLRHWWKPPRLIAWKTGWDMRTMKGCLRALLLGILMTEVLHLEVSAWGQAIGFQPVPAPFPSGTILDVTPAVSADRRYVRLSLNPTFSVLNGFTNYTVPAAVSGGGAGMNGAIGGLGGAGGLGALGGGNGVRSVGLGGPTVAGAAPGLILGTPAGDPFEQALRSPPAVSLPASPSVSQEEKPRTQAGNSQASAPRSQRRGASRPQHAIKTRRKTAGSSSAYGKQTLPEVPTDVFPFEP